MSETCKGHEKPPDFCSNKYNLIIQHISAGTHWFKFMNVKL